MIKENVLRKNLLTNEIDYGSVDSEFEQENLNKNIIKDHPYIELVKGMNDYKTFKEQELKEAVNDKIKNKCNEVDSVRTYLLNSNIISCVCEGGNINLKTDEYTQNEFTKIYAVFSNKSLTISSIPFVDTVEKIMKNITNETLVDYAVKCLEVKANLFSLSTDLKSKIRACKTIDEVEKIKIVL